MIRIYVIDDHLLIFDGLCMSFNFGENDIHVVGGSQDVDEALEKIKPDQVDIIILDLFIHNVSPVHNIRRLKRSFPSTPVVVLSQECSLFWQITMFINGAVAYCSKCDGLAKITETLERVYKGEKIIPQEVVKVIIPDNGCYDDQTFTQDLIEIILDLERGMTIKEIAAHQGKSESTLEKKLQSYRKHFGVKTNIELVCKISPQKLLSVSSDT